MPKITQKGFTFIELMVTVSIVAILSGVVIAVLNPALQQKRAKNAVRMATVEKLSKALEAQYSAEGTLPLTQTDFRNSTYIKSWPTDAEANYIYTYTYNSWQTKPIGCVSAVDATSNWSRFFIYISGWSLGSVIDYCTDQNGVSYTNECVGKVMYSCESQCSTGAVSIRGCKISM